VLACANPLLLLHIAQHLFALTRCFGKRQRLAACALASSEMLVACSHGKYAALCPSARRAHSLCVCIMSIIFSFLLINKLLFILFIIYLFVVCLTLCAATWLRAVSLLLCASLRAARALP